MVEPRPVTLGRDEAERDPEQHREEHRRHRELDRRGEPLGEVARHLAPVLDRVAEVALQGRLDPAEVLGVDRLVEAVLVLEGLDRRRRRALAEKRLGRAPRQGVDPEEDEEREPDDDRDEEDEPADDEAEHS